MSNTIMDDVRQLHNRRYNSIMWLKNNLEFDDTKRREYRLTSFCRRKILFEPVNIEDLVEIPYMYRFRFIGLVNYMTPIFVQEYNERLRKLNNLGIKDKSDTKNLYDSQLAELQTDLYMNIMNSSETIKLPFVVDIRKYDPLHINNNCIGINEIYLDVFISANTLFRLKRLRSVLNNENKITQMIESSKIISEAYKKFKNKQKLTLK